MSRYHKHKRQKAHKTLVAQKKTNNKFVDRLTYAAAIIEPIITIPQAYQLFRDQNAAGISILSWVGYEMLTIVWLWYGFVHKDKAIIMYSAMYAVVQMAVIVGAIKYGGSWL